MNKLLVVALSIFATSVFAEWVRYGATAQGDEYFYDSDRIQKRGENVSFWHRVRAGQILSGKYWSHEAHIEINCDEYSIKSLRSVFFSDDNWKDEAARFGDQGKRYVKPNSSMEMVANIVCKE